IFCGFGAKVDVANFAAVTRVATDCHEKTLAFAGFLGCGVCFQAGVVAERAAQEDVVPGPDVQRGNTNVRVVLLEVYALPIGVVGGMGKPVEEVRSERRCRGVDRTSSREIEERICGEGKNVLTDAGVGGFLDRAIEGVLCETRGPGFVEPLFEGATLAGPVVMIVAGGNSGTDPGEMRGMSSGGEHLRGADVGTAEHADFAVGIWKSGDPLNGVITIFGFVDEGIPVALRGVAATHILDHHDVAARGGRVCEIDAPAEFVVGSAPEEDGKFSVGVGAIDIGAKRNAIAHFHENVALDFDGKGFSGEERGNKQGQKKEKGRLAEEQNSRCHRWISRTSWVDDNASEILRETEKDGVLEGGDDNRSC